jgi:purine/pyrimidine-nucleoside phosphorylase
MKVTWGCGNYSLRAVAAQQGTAAPTASRSRVACANAQFLAPDGAASIAPDIVSSRPMTDSLSASIQTRANVYFDGKCVSHSLELPDGSRKSVGVILPSILSFKTGAPEVMELLDGRCRVRLDGSDAWVEYGADQSFSVPGQSAFDIEVSETLHYICHFG